MTTDPKPVRTEPKLDAATPLRPAVGTEIRRALGTRRRRALLLVTLTLGLAVAAAVTASVSPAQRSFAFTSATVQLVMSVFVPFFGVLLMSDRRRVEGAARVAHSLLAAEVLAVGVAVFGVLVALVATAVAPSEAVGGRWDHVGAVVVGSVLVQLIAQLTGTGWGLLLRRPVMAMLATIVVPLGLWFVLGAVDGLRPGQAWLTPFASASNLLSGQMRPVNWVQSLVVVLIWGFGLNTAGAYRARQRH